MTGIFKFNTLNRIAATSAVAFLGAGIIPVLAGPDESTMTVVFSQEVTNYDSYLQSGNEGAIIADNICDTLVYRDPETIEYKPLLAESLEWLDPLVLEVTLRENVVFHNGDPLTADDVVYTLSRAINPETKVVNLAFTNWIDRVEKVDDYVVRIHRKQPDPATMDYLATGLPIYPAAYHQEVGDDAFSRNPVCSGPYKIARIESGASVELERHEGYYADSPKGRPAIDKVVIRYIMDANVAIGELMTNQVDWMANLTPDDADNLSSIPAVTIQAVPSTRLAYLLLKSSGIADSEPMADLRVRRAIAHAINRDDIVDHLVGYGAKRLDSYCYPGPVGCKDGVANIPFDPDKARELLAEAGYPNGFDIDFYAYRDRFVSEALIGNLHSVGIRANMIYTQFSTLRQRWADDQLSLAHVTYGGRGLVEESGILSFYFAGGELDPGKDPAIIDAIRRATSTMDENERIEAYHEAFDRLGANVNWVPLYAIPIIFAFNSKLDFPGDFDGVVRFYRASWQ